MSSNLAEVYNVSVKLNMKRTIINKKRPRFALFKKNVKVAIRIHPEKGTEQEDKHQRKKQS